MLPFRFHCFCATGSNTRFVRVHYQEPVQLNGLSLVRLSHEEFEVHIKTAAADPGDDWRDVTCPSPFRVTFRELADLAHAHKHTNHLRAPPPSLFVRPQRPTADIQPRSANWGANWCSLWRARRGQPRAWRAGPAADAPLCSARTPPVSPPAWSGEPRPAPKPTFCSTRPAARCVMAVKVVRWLSRSCAGSLRGVCVGCTVCMNGPAFANRCAVHTLRTSFGPSDAAFLPAGPDFAQAVCNLVAAGDVAAAERGDGHCIHHPVADREPHAGLRGRRLSVGTPPAKHRYAGDAGGW